MQHMRQHSILLGSIGGDSHSVGLTILRQSLVMNGYQVQYLGIQNTLEDFFQNCIMYNVVMISNMDGHAHHYLSTFPELRKQYRSENCLWYLGGNLDIGDGVGCEMHFRAMGFHRVFVKFVDIAAVLAMLEKDLYGTEPKGGCAPGSRCARQFYPVPGKQVDDAPVDLESFEYGRREVLEHWKTGYRARCLEENAEFLGRQPSFPRLQMQANDNPSALLIQPRIGVPLVQKQIKSFQAFKSVGVQVLSYQVDSLTRNCNYSGVETELRQSLLSKTDTLNGFPVINHGVDALRRIMTEVKLPVQTRHSTRDPRLLAEISYAGGVTSFEGGAICYNIPYYKDYPLRSSVETWQYVDRLTGRYYDRFGIVLDREFFGTLTATLLPPCLAIAVDIIEAILAVQQGVKCVSLGYAEQGHRIQDIAAIRTLRQMAREILQNLGYRDIQVNTVFHQYMAAFPGESQRAERLIYNSAITAALSGATRVMVKTPVEAYKIPSLLENMHGFSLTAQGISAAQTEQPDEARINAECSLIRQEVQAILDSVILSGGGSIARGIEKSFQRGYLDIPFAPSIYNRGEVITVRDVEGAVRFLSPGNLQLGREVREFHRAKVQERLHQEGILSEKQGYLLVERDVMQIARGHYKSWPLFK